MAKFKPAPADTSDTAVPDAPVFATEQPPPDEMLSPEKPPEPVADVPVPMESFPGNAPTEPDPVMKFIPAKPGDTVTVNKLGLNRVLIGLMQGKESFMGPGARRAFREIYQCNDAELDVLWNEAKSYFFGGPNYDAIK